MLWLILEIAIKITIYVIINTNLLFYSGLKLNQNKNEMLIHKVPKYYVLNILIVPIMS